MTVYSRAAILVLPRRAVSQKPSTVALVPPPPHSEDVKRRHRDAVLDTEGQRLVTVYRVQRPSDRQQCAYPRRSRETSACPIAAIRPEINGPGPCGLKTITDTNGNHGRGERRLHGDRLVDLRRGVHEGLFHIDVRDPVQRDHIVQPGIERRANTGTVSRLGYPPGDIRMAVIEKHDRQPSPGIGDEIAILAMVLQRDRRR